ncbi:hypothetical protein G7Y31_09685 [Corynebacterium lizhenjunii]|uniref:Uncharacterized protein n=1 Tax=Corynebacterium lizhenjunii TaxID=2709394 RepID=A0A7T0KFM2_9CORY|nr:hypothetical protein [Corynebacterium lizhenjunii]QPK78798.1 hypothetical protein G7Y31_09685 [Corynebacterium lizhenjunii]
MRALIPVPWFTIGALILSAAVAQSALGGFSFAVPGRDDYLYFGLAEWWLYLATIAAIATCVPRLRTVDLGCRRARRATVIHAVIVVLLALAAAGLGAFVTTWRRTQTVAGYIAEVTIPGSEYLLVGTLTAAGIALLLVPFLRPLVGTMASFGAVVAVAAVHVVVPEDFPLPVPIQPYTETWWQPWSVVQSVAIFSLGLAVWAIYGGARNPHSGNDNS